jgi:hypothetical protein
MKYKTLFILTVVVEIAIVIYLVKTYFDAEKLVRINEFPINRIQDIVFLKYKSSSLKALNLKYFYTMKPYKNYTDYVLYDNEFSHSNRTIFYTFNSEGVRDREFSIEKPNGTFRIISIGYSWVMGLDVQANETHPKVLERMLNNDSEKIKYEVLNFGVSGYDLSYATAMFVEKGLKYHPDMITLIILDSPIRNEDGIIEFQNQQMTQYVSQHPNATQIDMQAFDDRMHDFYLNETYKISADQRWEENARRPLEIIGNISVSLRIPIIIYYYFPPKSPFISKIQNISEIYGFYLIDMRDIRGSYSDTALSISPNDNHPNPFYDKLIAEYLYSFMHQKKLIPS